MRLDIQHTWDGQPIGPEEAVRAELARSASGLRFSLDAPYHRDPAPDGRPGPTEQLWNFEVVEVFVTGPGDRYLEVEIGPLGHYLTLRLDGVRKPFASGLPLEVHARIMGERWQADAFLPSGWLPQTPWRVNAFAVHGRGEDRRYLCHAPTGGTKPDFHRLQTFVNWED